MLGVIIGVGAVILLISIGAGLQAMVESQFEDFGANNVYIASGDVFGEDGGGGFSEDNIAAQIASQNLRMEDLKEISRIKEHVSGVTAMSFNTGEVTHKNTSQKTTVAGVSGDYSSIMNTPAELGRFFTDIEDDRKERVAVLGSELASELFGGIDPIGKSITLNNRSFEVIGVAEEKGGGFGGPSFDTYVYIPIQTWHKLFDSELVLRIIAQARNGEEVDLTINAIEEYYLKRLEDDEFSVFEQTDILDIVNQILGALTAGLGGIAAISLLVGGIGIMNIMLVSVTERTREIGLRKALGATPKVILMQFLIEAVVLSVTGGLIGVAIAFGVSLLISLFIPAVVTPMSVLLAFGVSALVGIVFGVFPARKASKLSPIEALRYE